MAEWGDDRNDKMTKPIKAMIKAIEKVVFGMTFYLCTACNRFTVASIKVCRTFHIFIAHFWSGFICFSFLRQFSETIQKEKKNVEKKRKKTTTERIISWK